MNISYNWLKDYLDIDLSAEKIGEILTDIGLEVEGMEEKESIKGGLEGLVIGEITYKEKHPNADKLSLTKVNIGQDSDLSIVCGAPNVAKGQKVIVATVGTKLYPTEGDEFKIKKAKVRGEVSEGMICAEDEIGLGTSHDGIMVLPEDTPVGTLARDYFKVEKDIVFEIGLTPNRSDATSHIGVAKDLAAALKINYGHSGRVKQPLVDDFKVDNKDLPIEVVVENTIACPRYTGVSIKGVTIKESPNWLKNKLNSIGVRPISNIVDITNFILHELGQPLHAFDLDKITDGKVIVKNLPESTPFLSLDEIERKLSSEDLMICDGASNGMCIGGVFGGLNSGVTETTINIFLEAAHFNPISIRRSSTRHLLRTDAAKVFEKGSDPNICVYALKRAAMLIVELGGGEIASEVIDIYPNKIEKKEINVGYKNIQRLIGVEIPATRIKEILAAMEIDIVQENATELTVAIPTNKADVLREADVIEEILRIYGFNQVPIPSQVRSALTYNPKPNPHELRNIVSNHLSDAGFNEMMGLSISQSKYYKEILDYVDSTLVYINNTSNIHLDVMRPTMLFSGLEAILHNQNRQNANLRLYEYGKTYVKNEKGYVEIQHFSLFLSGQRNNESWLVSEEKAVSFYTLKAQVLNVLNRLGLNGFQESAIQNEVLTYGLSYHRGPQTLVDFGKIKRSILKEMGIKTEVFYADFNWDNILKALKKHKIEYKALNKFPTSRRDLALVIDKKIKFSDIVIKARKTDKKLLKEINLFDVYEDTEKLGRDKKSYAVSFTFEDPSKNLKDKEIDKIMNKLISTYENELGAVIRK